MKTRIFLISLIMASVCLFSCEHDGDGAEIAPTEKDLHNYIAALSHYYPYSINDVFIFRNESSGERWENKPFVYSGDSTYPETEIWLCDDSDASCYGDRTAQICSYFMEKGVSRYEYAPSGITTFIAKTGGSEDINFSWYVYLSFGAYDYYQGISTVRCMPEEVLNQLTDTIIIPIRHKGTASGVIAAPNGAYARIVTDKGLTDFSVDGTTVWRRVKE